MHQSSTKSKRRTVRVKDCAGRYAAGHTHTLMRSHTPFGCAAVSTLADDRAIIHWSVPRGQGLELDRVAQRPSMAGQR